MKLVLGIILGFLIGVGCQVFAIPAPAPPVIEGALLVVAMSVGYVVMDKILDKPCHSDELCGGPSGQDHSEEQ